MPSSDSNSGGNNSSNDSETKKNEVAALTPTPTPSNTSTPSTITAAPQTGDTFHPTLYVVAAGDIYARTCSRICLQEKKQ